jgi:hypothetical protein
MIAGPYGISEALSCVIPEKVSIRRVIVPMVQTIAGCQPALAKGWVVHFIEARTYAPLPCIADLIPLCTPPPVDVEQQESARHLQREANDI